jgi:hypothetical protein
LYFSNYVAGTLEFCGTHVSITSWSRNGTRIVAVGDGAMMWCSTADVCPGSSGAVGMDSNPDPNLRTVLSVPCMKLSVRRLYLGALSPDGHFLAMAALHARVEWVWKIDARRAIAAPQAGVSNLTAVFPQDPPAGTANACSSQSFIIASRAELSFGSSGIAAMQWKLRGWG